MILTAWKTNIKSYYKTASSATTSTPQAPQSLITMAVFSAMSAIAACKSLIAVMTVTRRPGTPARSKYGAAGVV
jgi:hypothetical protein